MVVKDIASLIPDNIKIEIVFDNNSLRYNKYDTLHIAACGNMVVSAIIPPEKIENIITLEIKALPERQ